VWTILLLWADANHCTLPVSNFHNQAVDLKFSYRETG
jgi:hypothetical protein